MSDSVFTFRIKLILTLALLAVVTAFAVTYLNGEARDKAAHDAAIRDAADARAHGVHIPP